MNHFFDIGANVGQTFDWLRTKPEGQRYEDHQFWMFEPSPRHLPVLMEHCAIERLTRKPGITVCPFGLAGGTGAGFIFEKDDRLGDSFHEQVETDHKTENIGVPRGIMAACVALPDIIAAVTKPDDKLVLDIDAEGSEYEMLTALVMAPVMFRRVVEVFVEWHVIQVSPGFITPGDFRGRCKDRGVKLTERGCLCRSV